MVYGYALAVFIGALALSALLHVPLDAEHWSYDWMVSRLSTSTSVAAKKIVLVYISDSTLSHCRCDYVSPIDRKLLSDLIQTIDKAEAKIIGLDVILDRYTEPQKDEMLRDTIDHTHAKMVIAGVKEGANAARAQPDFFLAPAGGAVPDVGYIYFDERHSRMTVSDHVVRFMVDSTDSKESYLQFVSSFAAVIARVYGVNFRPQSHYIAWLRRPTDGADTFMTLKAEDVLGRGGVKLPVQQLLRDKIVLIGGNFDDRDQHLTPLSVSRGDFYTGLFIHAQILAQLLDGRSIYELNIFLQLLLAVAIGICGFLLGRISGHHQIWLELFSVAILIAIAFLTFRLFSMVFPYNLLLFVWLAGAAVGHYGRLETRKPESEG